MSVTEVASRLFDLLMLKHPIRTTLGVLLGIVLQGVWLIWRSSNPAVADSLSTAHFVAAGLLALHCQTLFQAFTRKPLQDESIQQALAMVSDARRRGLPDYQIRKMYLDICEKLLSRIEMNAAARAELESLRSRRSTSR